MIEFSWHNPESIKVQFKGQCNGNGLGEGDMESKTPEICRNLEYSSHFPWGVDVGWASRRTLKQLSFCYSESAQQEGWSYA